MQSLKATCAGQIFALAKPHDSVGKKSRNRIPKEERKALVESFIKKHQNLNSGSFPSLSLTHREVGGSFYTIREIVREIIQENRVLGPADDLIRNGKGSDNLQDQSPSGSILIDPVAPLSLPPEGCRFASDQNHTILENLISVPSKFSSEAGDSNSLENRKNINGSQADLKEKVSDILNCKELNEIQMGSTEISMTQFAASHGEENDTKHDEGLQNRVQKTCDSFTTKPMDGELNVDNSGFVEIPSTASKSLKPVEDDERVNDAGAAIMEMANITKNTVCTNGMPSAVNSPDVQPSELDNFCEGGKGNETNVETDTTDAVDLRKISSSTSAVPEEKGTEVIGGPQKVIMEMEMANITKTTFDPNDMPSTMTSQDVHPSELNNFSEGGKGNATKVETDTIDAVDLGEISSSTSAVPVEKGMEVVVGQQKVTMEKGKLDDLDSFSSQKGSSATLNRIKPVSWKGPSNMGAREANPFLAVLKSFLTAFVKFWSE